MSYGIQHLGKDITSSHSYQLYDSGSATLTPGSFVGTLATYSYSKIGLLHRYDFPVLPGTGANTGLTFIKPTSVLVGVGRRANGGLTLIADATTTVNYMRFVDSRTVAKPTSGYGALVLGTDGNTVLLDMSKNNLVIRRVFNAGITSWNTNDAERLAYSHYLGYTPYLLANPVTYEFDLFGNYLVPFALRSTSEGCYAGIRNYQPSGTGAVTMSSNVAFNFILTDGA
jgi:hypothetical protein